ncbi:carboxymuconolactone decarboxylase family protein [Gordonia sputi]|uniref:carboxymuconolactone decarboxylase family protein n=1 Tax=Gordonia sputi TaxID=36823 RepID=UPI0020448F46|nr:carboxymuconolactone decarboxylase family protein [Gordonia sputi]MCM3896620.1 carboxymuconolactone decarboxylase family protein [Gordonia sputi]
MITTAEGTATTRRLWMPARNPNVYKALVALQRASSERLDPELIELIKIRASQLNGCAYCLRMHVSDALEMGIDPMVIGLIPVWHEAVNHFDERQRSALELTEYVTRIGEEGVPDAAFDRARAVFDEVELGQVVASIVMINAWNRVAIASKYPYELDERK